MTSKNEPLTTPALTTRGSPKPSIVKSIVEKSPNAPIGRGPRLEVVDLGHRERRVRDADARRALADVDQAILAAIDERPQQHAADDAEDRGVGADAERQRHDNRGGESLGASERAQADAHVLPKGNDGVEPAAVPDARASNRESPARNRIPEAQPGARLLDPRRARSAP